VDLSVPHEQWGFDTYSQKFVLKDLDFVDFRRGSRHPDWAGVCD